MCECVIIIDEYGHISFYRGNKKKISAKLTSSGGQCKWNTLDCIVLLHLNFHWKCVLSSWTTFLCQNSCLQMLWIDNLKKNHGVPFLDVYRIFLDSSLSVFFLVCFFFFYPLKLRSTLSWINPWFFTNMVQIKPLDYQSRLFSSFIFEHMTGSQTLLKPYKP